MTVGEIRWTRSDDPHGEGRRLLRELVFELSGVASVPITSVCPDCGGPHGKPVAEGTGLHLSLSYAGVVVVAAVSTVAIGVDVEERAQQSERLDAVATMTGSRDIRAWTRTEAVLKADGRGLRVDPREVTFHGDTATLDGTTYELREVDLAPELVVSVATAVAP